MSIKAALFEYLGGAAAVSALVKTRIYPAGDGSVTLELPYITYERLSNDHQRDLATGSGLTAARFDVTSWASSDKTSFDLAEAVRERLDNFRHGEWGTPTVHVQACFLEDDDDLFVGPDDGGNVGSHGTSQIYAIWYEESVTPV